MKLYGLSWNAQLGTSGIAFQGEVSYRQDAPYQADDVEVLFAALSPISAGLAAINQVAPGGLGFEEEVIGYRLLDSSQLQFTFTKIFSNILGADQGVVGRRVRLQQGLGHAVQGRASVRGPGHLHQRQPAHVAPGRRPRGQTLRGSQVLRR